jgi:hypothetical protein
MTNAKEAVYEAKEALDKILKLNSDRYFTKEEKFMFVDGYDAGYSAASLEWSSDPPSEPGWYWERRNKSWDCISVIEVSEGRDGILEADRSMSFEDILRNKYPIEWAGPIPLPGEKAGT